MAAVSVIIPTWNRADLLAKVLPALNGQTHRPGQILVVDNGSSDDSIGVAREHGAEVIALPKNIGFAGAVNEGIGRATGEWLLIANNDVDFPPEWLELLLATAENEGALFATGKLLMKAAPWTIDGTWDMLSRGAYAWRCGYGHRDGPVWSASRRIWFAPMTAALFHRSVFDGVGLLDTRFEAYYEDVDFGLRCAVAGFEGIYEPRAIAVHSGTATLGKNGRRVMYLTARNQVLLLAKHYTRRTLLLFAWPLLVGQTLALFAAGRHGHFWTAVRAKWDALRMWPQFRSEPQHYTPALERNLIAAISECDRQILALQKADGFDIYWRLYFGLVRPA